MSGVGKKARRVCWRVMAAASSRRNQWFINNRSVAAGVEISSLVSRLAPVATVLNSYYVGAEWEPACQRQEEEQAG